MQLSCVHEQGWVELGTATDSKCPVRALEVSVAFWFVLRLEMPVPYLPGGHQSQSGIRICLPDPTIGLIQKTLHFSTPPPGYGYAPMSEPALQRGYVARNRTTGGEPYGMCCPFLLIR